MYAVETAKMSSKGQLVIPDAFRKSYGWTAGMTLLMIGTGNSVVLQPLAVPNDEQVDEVVRESRAAAREVTRRLKKAESDLAKLAQVGISMPVDFEKQSGVQSRRAGKYA